jgi:hypothetical protein
VTKRAENVKISGFPEIPFLGALLSNKNILSLIGMENDWYGKPLGTGPGSGSLRDSLMDKSPVVGTIIRRRYGG